MRKNILYYLTCTISASALAFTAFPQQQEFLPLTKLNKENLLPSLNARKILQDKLGFLWAATQEGVYRFDGASSRLYSRGSVDRRLYLNGTDIFDLALDDTGEYLWALGPSGELTKISIEDGTTTLAFSLKGTQTWSRSLDVTHEYLYIGTADGKILRVNKSNQEELTVFTAAERLHKKGSVDKIFQDHKKNLWFLISGIGIVTADPAFRNWQFVPDNTTKQSNDSLEYTDAAISAAYAFITTKTGIRILDLENKIYRQASSLFKGLLPELLNQQHFDCITIKDQTAFVAGPKNLLKISLPSGKYSRVIFSRNKDNMDWLLFTSSIYFDGKSLWIGAQYGTAYVRDIYTPVTAFYESMDNTSLKLEHCMTVFHRNAEAVYVCTDNGLYRVSLESGILKRISRPKMYVSGICLPGDYSIASGPDGTTLFSRDIERNIGSVFPELVPLAKESFVAMVNLRDSLYFFAGFDPRHFFCWNWKRRTLNSIKTENWTGTKKGFFTKKLFLDSRQKLWVLFDGSITQYDPLTGSSKEITLFFPGTRDTLNINMDMAEDRSGYWIAAYGHGLTKVSGTHRAEKMYGSKEGFNNIGLNCVVPLSDSLLAVSTNNGLSILNPGSESMETFFEEDGTHSNYFEQFSGVSLNNKALFGGFKGLTLIDPAKLGSPKPIHPVYITSVRVQTDPNTAKDYYNTKAPFIEVPPGTLQVIINFSAINFDSPEKYMFASRINESDSNWVNTGNLRSLTLMGLQPGTYTVEIRYLDGNNAASGNMARVSLKWLPYWYQTWWFRLALMIAGASLLYAFYRYRIRQINAQHQIRKNIASDLHDDIGSSLNSVKVFTHLAKQDHHGSEYLLQIEEALADATTGLRDMIWVLDDSQDTVLELVERIKKFALPVTLVNRIAFECKVKADTSYQKLLKNEKRNLLLMAKEVINNSIKYAACNKITLSFQQYKENKMLVIEDDGKGFDSTVVSEGNGLKNLVYRANQIDYQIEIISSAGKGTLVKISKNGSP